MSDRIGVFNHGRLEQVGTPQRGLQRAGHALRGAVRRRRQRARRRAGAAPHRPQRGDAAARAHPPRRRRRRARLGRGGGSAVLRRLHPGQGRFRRHAAAGRPARGRRHRRRPRPAAPCTCTGTSARCTRSRTAPGGGRPLTAGSGQRDRRRRRRRRSPAPAPGCGAAPPTCCTRGAACCCWRCSRRSLLWFGVVYLGSLFALLANAFFGLDDFTGQVVREFTLKNFVELVQPANVDVAIRTDHDGGGGHRWPAR